MLQPQVRKRPPERILLSLLAAVPPPQLRRRQPVVAHRHHRGHRLQQPLLPVPVAPEHPVHRLLRPPGRPVRHRERPFLPRRVQGLPLVLPQPPRGRQAQNRGLPARIGHAPGIIPALPPAGAHQILAGVRAGGPQPHRQPPSQPGCRILVQLLPPIPPHVRAARMQPGAAPRRPHAHRVQPGLPLAVAAALGVLAQLALHLDPRAVPAHRDGPLPPPARLRPQRHQPPLTSRAHCRKPSSAASCIRCRPAPSRRLAGTARSPHARRVTSAVPRAATAGRCPPPAQAA